MENKSQDYKLLKNVYKAKCKMNFALAVFGDTLAQRQNYKVHKGLDAIHYYLVERYRWKLSDVQSLSYKELNFLLKEEMHGWELPEDAEFEE